MTYEEEREKAILDACLSDLYELFYDCGGEPDEEEVTEILNDYKNAFSLSRDLEDTSGASN